MEREGKIFEGSTDVLETTFSDALDHPSAGMLTEPFITFIVYWTCSGVVGGGAGLFTVEMSYDGNAWFACPDEQSANGRAVSGQGSGAWVGTTKCGKYTRILFHKTAGTSVTLSAVVFEAKS